MTCSSRKCRCAEPRGPRLRQTGARARTPGPFSLTHSPSRRDVTSPAGIDRKCREPQASDDGKDSPGLKEPHHLVRLLQARQESNLQPPVLERSSSDAGVEAFVDFQELSSGPATPALLDDTGVGTNPGTEEHLEGRLAREVTDSKAGRARPLPQRNRGFLIERMRSLNTT